MSISSPSITAEIVETLESHGIARDEYRLADEVDPEALARVVDSAAGSIEVRVAILPTQLSGLGMQWRETRVGR
ncbi:hypothetical protein [Halostagnicola bangensis]